MAIGALGLASSAQAADIFNVNFDTGYAVGNSYSAATDIGNVTGSAPTKITGIGNFGTVGAWTATVTDSGTTEGNYLKFDIAAGATFNGRIEAYTGGPSSGLVHCAFDFTRISTGGGNVFRIVPLTSGGNGFTNETLYLDAYLGSTNVNFTPGLVYNIDTVVNLDLGSYEVYVDGALKNTGTASNFGSEFAGLQLQFSNNSDTVDRSFAIDNIVAGAVPEPASLSLLGLAGLGLLRRRNK